MKLQRDGRSPVPRLSPPSAWPWRRTTNQLSELEARRRERSAHELGFSRSRLRQCIRLKSAGCTGNPVIQLGLLLRRMNSALCNVLRCICHRRSSLGQQLLEVRKQIPYELQETVGLLSVAQKPRLQVVQQPPSTSPSVISASFFDTLMKGLFSIPKDELSMLNEVDNCHGISFFSLHFTSPNVTLRGECAIAQHNERGWSVRGFLTDSVGRTPQLFTNSALSAWKQGTISKAARAPRGCRQNRAIQTVMLKAAIVHRESSSEPLICNPAIGVHEPCLVQMTPFGPVTSRNQYALAATLHGTLRRFLRVGRWWAAFCQPH